MSPKRRVFELVGSLEVGGAERVATELAAGLTTRGWQVELLVAPTAAETGTATVYSRSIAAEAEQRGVRVHRVTFEGVRNRLARRRLRDFLVEHGAELVHVHNRPQDWQVMALCRMMGLPGLFTVHMAYTHKRLRERLLYAACTRSVPYVVCVSRSVADTLRAQTLVPADRVRVIYNGIRVDTFRPSSPEERARKRAELGWEDDAFIWLFAARFAEQKGHQYLLDAARCLPKNSRSRIVLAGEGHLEAAARAKHQHLGLADRVAFLGARRDMPGLLGAVDGFVCSSMAEGHPLSILEAMATELPVVAPRLPSIEEIATDSVPVFFGRRQGAWAEPHNPRQIAAALLSVERDPKQHRAKARLARSRVCAQYSLDSMLDGHEALYSQLIEQRAVPRRVLIPSVRL